MKRLILLMMGVMFFSLLSAQNNTKVLLEMTTATGCYHCPSGNHYIDSLANLHPDKVIVLRYQFPLNSYDPIYYQDSAEINQRSKTIFPTGQYSLPGTYCNGVYHTISYPDRLTSDSIDSVYQVRNHFYPPELSVHQMSSMTLYFDIAHIKTGGSPDTLEIFLSDNCGKTWASVYKKTGDEFAYTSIPWPEWSEGVPDSTVTTDWKRQTVTLTGYSLDSKINLRFKYTHGEGNNVHLRNLYIGPSVGIPERHAGLFIIHPNPAQGVVTVESTNGNG